MDDAVNTPFHGVFVSLGTPFEDNRLAFDWLESNLEGLNRTPIKGYLVLGGNGEFMSLSEEVRWSVVETVVSRAGAYGSSGTHLGDCRV
jgi:4-hydroxy-2-oxoglutarate aldolase